MVDTYRYTLENSAKTQKRVPAPSIPKPYSSTSKLMASVAGLKTNKKK